MDIKKCTYDEWLAKGRELFGPDIQAWKFVCPACGHIASVKDWSEAAAKAPGRSTNGLTAYSCIGRLLDNPRDAFGKGPGPCNYAGGGLFRLNPVHITDRDDLQVFDFAYPENDESKNTIKG